MGQQDLVYIDKYRYVKEFASNGRAFMCHADGDACQPPPQVNICVKILKPYQYGGEL